MTASPGRNGGNGGFAAGGGIANQAPGIPVLADSTISGNQAQGGQGGAGGTGGFGLSLGGGTTQGGAGGSGGFGADARGGGLWTLGPATLSNVLVAGCLRAALGERGDVFVHVEPFKSGKYPTKGYHSLKDRRIPDKDIYLQVERRGTDFTFSRSTDGEAWEAVVKLSDLDFSKKLRVGVAVVNSTKKEVSPQFAEFMLTGK
jgi:hypothetical protein